MIVVFAGNGERSTDDDHQRAVLTRQGHDDVTPESEIVTRRRDAEKDQWDYHARRRNAEEGAEHYAARLRNREEGEVIRRPGSPHMRTMSPGSGCQETDTRTKYYNPRVGEKRSTPSPRQRHHHHSRELDLVSQAERERRVMNRSPPEDSRGSRPEGRPYKPSSLGSRPEERAVRPNSLGHRLDDRIHRPSSPGTRLEDRSPRSSSRGSRLEDRSPRSSSQGSRLDERVPRPSSQSSRLDERVHKLSPRGSRLDERVPRSSSQGSRLDERAPRPSSRGSRLDERVRLGSGGPHSHPTSPPNVTVLQPSVNHPMFPFWYQSGLYSNSAQAQSMQLALGHAMMQGGLAAGGSPSSAALSALSMAPHTGRSSPTYLSTPSHNTPSNGLHYPNPALLGNHFAMANHPLWQQNYAAAAAAAAAAAMETTGGAGAPGSASLAAYMSGSRGGHRYSPYSVAARGSGVSSPLSSPSGSAFSETRGSTDHVTTRTSPSPGVSPPYRDRAGVRERAGSPAHRSGGQARRSDLSIMERMVNGLDHHRHHMRSETFSKLPD